ncbi:MAG TPA: ATP-binding protein [Solirubrobacterales bacterium]|nr:ATP-binding protein [Solirubrobacterales bacterium]
MSRIPIRLRVTLAFSLAMAVLLSALGLFIYTRFESELSDQIDQSLRTHGDDIASLVAAGDLAPNSKLLGREESSAQVLTPDGRVYVTTPQLGQDPQIAPADAARATQASFIVTRDRVRGIDGEARVLARPAQGPGGSYVVVTASSLDDRNDSLSNLRGILLIGGPVALLLASLAGYALAGTALRPVEAMRRRAAAISAAEPAQRLPLPEADDELRRLGETLNAMLGRLEAALERERGFVDDASHELRTPLALHKTELELALRYAQTPEEMRAAIASAIVEVDRLIALAEDLLVLARSAEGKLALQLRRVGVAELLTDIRERFAARASQAGRSLTVVPANGVTIDADRLRLERALANLIENAFQHGEGEITVRATETGHDLQIHVEDAGPGFPQGFIERAFERFTRGDPARTGDGTGLGLAIVDAIARAHRGSAHAANRDGQGADVWIELPANRN